MWHFIKSKVTKQHSALNIIQTNLTGHSPAIPAVAIPTAQEGITGAHLTTQSLVLSDSEPRGGRARPRCEAVMRKEQGRPPIPLTSFLLPTRAPCFPSALLPVLEEKQCSRRSYKNVSKNFQKRVF